MSKMRSGWAYARRQGLVGILVTVVAALGFRSAVADWYDVPTGSMQPTILIGDRIFVNKLAYDLTVPFAGIEVARRGDPERGDIVICASPADGVRLVKRVIALPGDVIAMQGGQLVINGEVLDYEAAPGVGAPMGEGGRGMEFSLETLGERVHPVAHMPWRRAVRDFGPVEVPAGKYFMMGDNRDNSGDSRHWGFVDREAISGRVTCVALSLDREHGWLPRWSRFGRELN